MTCSSSGVAGWRRLPRSFFLPEPTVVAPALLGKLLLRQGPDGRRRARIVETEAYLGEGDAAAHAAAGLTARTAPLFGPPGHAYIFLVYGLHLCLNVSCLPEGRAGGVLLRAAEEEPPGAPGALSGPGRLTRALGIGLELNRCDLTRGGALCLADDGWRPAAIVAAPRVGIGRAAELPYRYCIAGHAAVSAPRPAMPAISGIAPIAPERRRRVQSGRR